MFMLQIRVFDRQVRHDSRHAQAPKKALMNKSIMENLVGQHRGSRAGTFPAPRAGHWPWLGLAFPGSVTWNRPLEQAPRPGTSHTSSFDVGISQHNMVSERD